jgi:hypothetical protein
VLSEFSRFLSPWSDLETRSGVKNPSCAGTLSFEAKSDSVDPSSLDMLWNVEWEVALLMTF